MILETERLILREYVEEDFEALRAVISDPENMKFYDKPYDDEGVRRWIRWCRDSYENLGFGLWAMELRETGEFIGDCGISMQIIDHVIVPEIGYHVRLDLHNQGYATEAARACKDWIFENSPFEKVYSYMNAENIGSYTVAEKNGMTLQKEYDDHGTKMKVYAITRDEWYRKDVEENLTPDPEDYSAADLWARFCDESGTDPETPYSAWAFGGAPDELAGLVLAGIKEATSSAYPLYALEGEPLPTVGEYSVVMDSEEHAVCVIRTKSVRVLPYNEITGEMAALEGEGDRSLAYWQEVHEEFFRGELSSAGLTFDPSMPVCFEEFEVVYRP